MESLQITLLLVLQLFFNTPFLQWQRCPIPSVCPGGVVIPASTQAASLAVNGMSYSQRDGKDTNSAILVQIPAKDFDHGHPLDGCFPETAGEKKLYIDLFNAPSENIKDYIDHTSPSSLRIESSYPEKLLSMTHASTIFR